MQEAEGEEFTTLEPRCRLCLQWKDIDDLDHGLQNIYNEDDDSLPYKIRDCLGVFVSPEDSVHTICTNCLQTVNLIDEFRMLCRQTEEIYESVLIRCEDSDSCERYGEYIGELRKLVQEHKTKINGQLVGVEEVVETVDEDSISTHFVPMFLVKDEPVDDEKYLSDEPPMAMEELDIKPEQLPTDEDEDDDGNKLEVSEANGSASFLLQIKLAEALLKRLNRFTSKVENHKQLWAEIAEHMDMGYAATRTRWNRMKRRYLDSKASAATASQQTILRLKGCTLFKLMNQIVPKLDKSVEPWVAPESVKRLNEKVYPTCFKTAIAEEIRKCPELYDKSLASSTHTMDQAWKKIAKMFDMDAENLRFHWRSLQDLYRTHTRRLKLGIRVRAKTDVQFYKLIGILESIYQVIDAGAVKQESVAEQCTADKGKGDNLLKEQEEVGEDAEEKPGKNVETPPDSQRMILAKLVYQHKHLWNKKHQDFHNALARDTAWDRIATKVEVTREEVKYSWKCLRDLYRGRVKRLKQGTLRPNARVLHEPLFKQLELMFAGNMRIGSLKEKSQKTTMVNVPKSYDSDSDDATDGDSFSSKIECDTNMRLAELCEKHSIIWNSKHRDHANKERRDIVWDSIAGKMDLNRAQTKAMWTRLRNVYRGRRLRLLKGNLAKDSPLLQEPLYQKLNAMLKDHMHLGKYGGGHHKGERMKPSDTGPFPSTNAKVKLVEEVIKHEFLWNATHPDFHNAIMRENTWRRIAVSLNQSSTQTKYAYKLLRDSYRSRMKRMKQTNTDPADLFEYDPLFEKMHIMFSKNMRIKIKPTATSESQANMEYESESNDVCEDNEGDDTQQSDIDENMKLLLLCEKNELIWNSKHSDHFNHEKRDAVWDAIALETNLSKTSVKEMWTRLRNIYRTRRLRYLQGSITKKNHLLCDPLYKKLHAMLHGHMQLGKHGGGFPKTNGPGNKPGDSGPFSSMENKVKLVKEVFKHEHLWNTTHVDFHNAVVRDYTWSRIAVSLNESVAKLKYAFKLMRDAYRYRVKQMKQSDTDLNRYFEHDPQFEILHMMYSKSNKYQKIGSKKSAHQSESNVVSEDNVGGDTDQHDIDENMRLVLICEKNETIWNSAHPDYMNYKKRDEVWNTIAQEMNLTRTDVKGMWTRLRHIYRTRRLGYLQGSITNKNCLDPLYQKLHALFDGHMQLGKYGGGFPKTNPRKKKTGDAAPISSMEDKVKFVKEVFKHEHLWNTTHPGYFKSDMRGATWNHIASMFNNCDAWAARGEWLRLRNMHRPRRSHGARHYEPMDDNEEPEPPPVISNPLYDLFSKMAESLTAENEGDPGDDGEPSGLTRTKRRPKKRQIEEITEAYMTHKRRFTGKRSFDDEGCIKVTKGGIVRYEKICELCGKQIERSYFEYHMNQHNGLKPYACSIEGCGRQYSNKITRDRHEVMIHCDEGYKYECDQCDEKFKYRSTFDYHYAIKHKSQKIPCPICGKLLKHKTLLREHMRRHNGHFPCNVCGKVLQKKYSLDVHMRTHTNEKPYTCEICGQCFMLKVQKKTHLAKVHQMSWEEFQTIYGSTSQQ